MAFAVGERQGLAIRGQLRSSEHAALGCHVSKVDSRAIDPGRSLAGVRRDETEDQVAASAQRKDTPTLDWNLIDPGLYRPGAANW